MNSLVTNLLSAALMECCQPSFVAKTVGHRLFDGVRELVREDLEAFAQKDPAARGDPCLVAQHYSSFRAVLHYRLAHALWASGECGKLGDGGDLETAARLISCRGKLLSGAEIHPNSEIGRRFILDHGFGTVVGETTRIGDDCYLLGGVTLGATGIAGNPQGKRHPTIGNRVQIGAFVRLLGPIEIGDDVFIGPHCVIKDDIAPGATVVLKSELQITRPREGMPIDRERNAVTGLSLCQENL